MCTNQALTNTGPSNEAQISQAGDSDLLLSMLVKAYRNMQKQLKQRAVLGILHISSFSHQPFFELRQNLLRFLHCQTGVQFIWDSCCESVKKANSSPGSGCILAHCMGLGKTLQVTIYMYTPPVFFFICSYPSQTSIQTFLKVTLLWGCKIISVHYLYQLIETLK